MPLPRALGGPLTAAALLLASGRPAEACTTLAVGRKASADGSVMLSHSDDAEQNADARLCYIPSAEYPANSTRPIYYDTEDFPRFVGEGRGECYRPAAGQTPYEPIGHIPQVAKTFAYFEATYGIMNEHNVGIGESTCSGVFGTDAVGHGGKALLSVDSLSRIAMERAATAREAVQLMGDLAVEHGFYGAGSFEGSAESLMVGDPQEVYIFHILPDPTGTSAVWAAQRVPDDHVAVVANMFVIRKIDFDDAQNFLFSDTVQSVAQDKGWWTPGTPLDFTAIYSDGEYASKFYSGRRVWGAYRKWGVDLPDDYADLRYDAVYPVTAKPKTAVEVRDLFAIHRYYYQGTKYDMTKGLAAGPWGDPDRYMTTSKTVQGNWERSIGLYRTSSTHVVQARTTGQGSVLWYGPHSTTGTCFVPLTTRMTTVPFAYTVGDPNVMNRSSAYWAHRSAYNVAKLKYSYAMEDYRAVQDKLEADAVALVQRLDKESPKDVAKINAAFTTHAEQVVKAFWSLGLDIVAKYADGWLADKTPIGYPDWWLTAVGYQNGPPPPPKHPKCEDADAQVCIRACPAQGFASCAAECLGSCSASRRFMV